MKKEMYVSEFLKFYFSQDKKMDGNLYCVYLIYNIYSITNKDSSTPIL